MRPSGEKARPLTQRIGIPRGCPAPPALTSYRRMSGSTPPTASDRPSGENARARARPRWSRKEWAPAPPAASRRATRPSIWMVAIVAPSGANAKARMGVSPTPRTRLAGVASLGGPEIGSQGRTMSPRRSRPIRPRLHQGNREIPIRDLLGPLRRPRGSGRSRSCRGEMGIRSAIPGDLADGRSMGPWDKLPDIANAASANPVGRASSHRGSTHATIEGLLRGGRPPDLSGRSGFLDAERLAGARGPPPDPVGGRSPLLQKAVVRRLPVGAGSVRRSSSQR